MDDARVFIGAGQAFKTDGAVRWAFFRRDGEDWQRIVNYDAMPHFFMTLASAADHWCFISSNGGLTCGRGDAERALFPYYTEDKLVDNAANTGALTIIRATDTKGVAHLWEPFSERYRGVYAVSKTIEKSVAGDKLRFVERNEDLGLEVSQTWMSSPAFGFVRKMELTNVGATSFDIRVLDGLRNVLPAGVSSKIQNDTSCLLDAYKRTEWVAGVTLFTMSSLLTDLPEPSEALVVNVAWSMGLPESAGTLLCERQIDAFRHGYEVENERDVRGVRGAFLKVAAFEMPVDASCAWLTIADVGYDHSAVTALLDTIAASSAADIQTKIQENVAAGSAALRRYVAAADGLQKSGDAAAAHHHFANVMFNIMRGGVPVDGYTLDKADLAEFIQSRARHATVENFISTLPERPVMADILKLADTGDNPDMARWCREYLPFTFSRRHGDPSRPWNRFAIAAPAPDGKPRIDYQGNWRDIFQNWEALCLSYPLFFEPVICKFLNASTADGYNPYRLTRAGVEWEEPEPDNPWSGIGYWGDHQIVYLTRLLEWSHHFYPEATDNLLSREIFTYAEVPYEIKPFADLVQEPRDSIIFNFERHAAIERRARAIGADGKLLHHDGDLVRVNMLEKLLVPVLAKLTNLVPGGGIWMNTMRPEWNDANNALAGWGLSVVTTAQIRRHLVLLRNLTAHAKNDAFKISAEIADMFRAVAGILTAITEPMVAVADPEARQHITAALGEIGSAYRDNLYRNGLGANKATLAQIDILACLDAALLIVDATLEVCRRSDGLHHAYNVLVPTKTGFTIEYLQEMLEGQVAALSSGILSSQDCLATLAAMRRSALFRRNQNTYMLYPDRKAAGFMERNQISAATAAKIPLIAAMAASGDGRIVRRDIHGTWHFNSALRNAKDLAHRLDIVSADYADSAQPSRNDILELYETVFNHRAFTGRSGSFFGYEGLGSVYWHMVAKLLLAVQENVFRAHENGEPEPIVQELRNAYFDIRAGLGFNKSPLEYGAFPTDPYSHTPGHSGARQPGMTGQVKEEVITRLGEMGIRIKDGSIAFCPLLIRREEYITEESSFEYIGLDMKPRVISMPPRSLAFTFCQVPFVHILADVNRITVLLADGQTLEQQHSSLSPEITAGIGRREGRVAQVTISWNHETVYRPHSLATPARIRGTPARPALQSRRGYR